jgi:hypothetical protein
MMDNVTYQVRVFGQIVYEYPDEAICCQVATSCDYEVFTIVKVVNNTAQWWETYVKKDNDTPNPTMNPQ